MTTHVKSIIAVFVCGWLYGAVATAEDTLESVEKALTKRWKNVDSYTAKVSMRGMLAFGGRSNETTGDGSFDLSKSGGAARYRLSMTTETVSPTFNSDEFRTSETILSIGDGDDIYIVKTQRALGLGAKFTGHLAATSMPRMDIPSVVDVTKVFKTLRDRVKLELVSANPSDLPPVYVVDVAPKDETLPLAKMTVYFAKDSGVVLRTVSTGRTADWTIELNYENVDLTAKPQPSRFIFHAPKGGVQEIPE